jgi:geranylgeranyl pyrophosphate synthase
VPCKRAKCSPSIAELLEQTRHVMQQCAGPTNALTTPSDHHFAASGKGQRALLCLTVSNHLGLAPDTATHLAAAIELLHNASLVHDDLVDRDTTRRGQHTVWKQFGDATALNLGDLYIVGAFRALAEMPAPQPLTRDVLTLFTTSVQRVINGHAVEMQQTQQITSTLADYEAMAKAKSGVLFALPVLASLILAEAPTAWREAAQAALEDMGLAYQMQDDLFDLLGCKQGRSAGGDLRGGRITLPVVLFLAQASAADRDRLTAFLARDPSTGSTTNSSSASLELDAWLARLRQPDVLQPCQTEFQRVYTTINQHLSRLPTPLRAILEQGRDHLLPRGFIEEILPATPTVPSEVRDTANMTEKEPTPTHGGSNG